MAKITFLGTAASISSADRDNTSFLFRHKKELLLIDCPGSIVQKLSKINVNFTKINKIILTHHHPDHIYGLSHLIHAQAYFTKHLYIFTNQHTTHLIKKLISLMSLNRKIFPKIHYINVFKNNFFYHHNSLKLKAVRNKHTHQSFGVRFTFDNKSLLYSSDTAFSKEILGEAKECEYVIHDCTASSSFFRRHPKMRTMHTDSLSLKEMFINSPIKKIIPVHFLLLTPYEEKRIRKELAPLKGKLTVPRDFQTLIV